MFRIALALFVVCTAALPLPAEEGFTLKDSIGRSWRHELVRFSVSGADYASAEAGNALVLKDGKSVPYQLIRAAKGTGEIAFVADLDAFETRTYRFADKAVPTSTDLLVQETTERIEIGNSEIGIALLKSPAESAAPISGLRMGKGAWFGTSRLQVGRQVLRRTRFEATVVARGPVFAEALCRSEFEGGATWEMRFRVIAGEPVVLVEEEFSLGTDAWMTLSLGAEFLNGQILYRHGAGSVGTNALAPARAAGADPAGRGAPASVFVLEPWLHWWERERQGNWCGFAPEKGGHLLAFGALNGELWVDPASSGETRSAPRVVFAEFEGGISARFPLRGGKRRWMAMALDREKCLDVMKNITTPGARGPVAVRRCPLPQKFVIRYGDFPLDRVKGWVLEWPGGDGEDGRLKGQVERFRHWYKPDAARVERFRKGDVAEYELDEAVALWASTGDVELGKNLARQSMAAVQRLVDRFLEQESVCTMGTEPHRLANELLPAVNLSELALWGKNLAAEDRRKLRAQLAFLRYTVGLADFFSPARGYSANPNMTSSVAAFQARLAATVMSHPQGDAWFQEGMNELVRELNEWSDAEGGWLEAPHYAMVAYDTILGCLVLGGDERVFDPKSRKVLEWLAKISTPPDPRAGGRRHFPPIGNTPLGEPTSEFGLAAGLWRDKDPEFASHMQWMHRQHGSFAMPGIGGFFPTLAGYRTLLQDTSVPAKAPDWKSEWFPETGVILRSGFATDRETQLHLIAGRNHAHYDDDSGSITLWGKGRPMVDDFGYSGVAAADDHNLLISKAVGPDVMQVERFATTERLDVVEGKRGGWNRRILFVKDADPLAPSYFVVRDSLAQPAPATWRLWFASGRVSLHSQSARVEELEDATLDVIFAGAKGPELKTEERTRTGTGLKADGTIDTRMAVTRTGLAASSPDGTFLVVLFPRLAKDASPEVVSLADGRVLRISTSAGTDYVFLAADSFTFNEESISFSGTTGLVSIRGDRVSLSLGAAGSAGARGHLLKEEAPASREWK